MRKTLILGNWKMHKDFFELEPFFKGIASRYKPSIFDKVELGVAPSFPFIYPAKELLKKYTIENFYIGAQNLYYEENGAFTGEVSVPMLESINTDFVILGHSERRHIFNESNELIAKKLKALEFSKMTTVLCVGETKEAREQAIEKKVVQEQLDSALKELSSIDTERFIIAYEPVWAIGTGLTASPIDADTMHDFIRTRISEIYGKTVADRIKILYGGSVKSANIASLIEKENIDGALVGGASLDFNSFLDIVDGAIGG